MNICINNDCYKHLIMLLFCLNRAGQRWRYHPEHLIFIRPRACPDCRSTMHAKRREESLLLRQLHSERACPRIHNDDADRQEHDGPRGRLDVYFIIILYFVLHFPNRNV